MLKNYLIAALRNIKRKKVFSLINIIGMAVGMAGFAFFAHLAGVKLNADKFHNKGDRIYGVIQVLTQENKEDIHTAFTPAPLSKTKTLIYSMRILVLIEKELPSLELQEKPGKNWKLSRQNSNAIRIF